MNQFETEIPTIDLGSLPRRRRSGPWEGLVMLFILGWSVVAAGLIFQGCELGGRCIIPYSDVPVADVEPATPDWAADEDAPEVEDLPEDDSASESSP